MSPSSYSSLQKLRQFTSFHTLQDIDQYDSVKLSDDSKYIVTSYTFHHTHSDFIKECDLVNKRRQTRYDYTSDGLQCTVSVTSPYTGTVSATTPYTGTVKTSKKFQSFNLQALPIEIVVNILNFSKIDDIKNLALVSKRFATIVQVELQRNILVREHVEDNGKFVGDGIFANQTLVSYKKFTENVIFLKKNFVKSIHFEEAAEFLPSSHYNSLLKLLPDTEILFSDSKNNPPISANPRRAHLHPQFNAEILLKEHGSSFITRISIRRNIFPGEVLFQYLRKFPSLEFIEIDTFKTNKPLVISEAEKLRLKFLNISGETYNDMFEVIQPQVLRFLHIEQLDLNGKFWSKLERLEGISLGSTNDKLLYFLDRIPSKVLKRFMLIFHQPIAEAKMFEFVSQFKKSLSNPVVFFDRCHDDLYGDEVPEFNFQLARLHEATYKLENITRMCGYTCFRWFLGENNFPARQLPVPKSFRSLTVFTNDTI